jgi:hypothetical protein
MVAVFVVPNLHTRFDGVIVPVPPPFWHVQLPNVVVDGELEGPTPHEAPELLD